MTQMQTVEVSTESETSDISIPQEGKLDPIWAKIDFVAIVITLLGISLLGMAAMVFAVIELAKLVSNLWLETPARWLIICLALAIIWVTFRWKKSRLS